MSVGTSFAEESDTSTESNISADLERLNITRTNNSNFTRRLVSAVPGVDGRILRGPTIAQDTPSAAITTEPPATTPAATIPVPEPAEKAACGPTLLIGLALLPLALKREI